MQRKRSSHPRINCLVIGCNRGTTRVPPHADGGVPEIICGPHWLMVPKPWRRRMALYRRRYVAAERRDDQHGMEVAARCWWSRWLSIVALFNEARDVADGEMPFALTAGLKAHGLL